MADDNLDHLLPRREEIRQVSPWASVQLRYIRDDLAPLIDKGVPIKHLLTLLKPLGITRRRETLRQFVLDEFPEQYARYYAKRATAARIRDEVAEKPVKPRPNSEKKEADPPTSQAPMPAKESGKSPQTKRLSVDSMLGQIGDFSAGKHFENEKGE